MAVTRTRKKKRRKDEINRRTLPGAPPGTLAVDPEAPRSSVRVIAYGSSSITDKQIDDLFETARFYLRPRAPGSAESVSATVPEWREAFKSKRDEIASRRCDVPAPSKR